MLAFAAIHRKADGAAIGAMESFVAMEDGLGVVDAGRNLGELFDGIAGGGGVKGLRSGDSDDVHAEHELGARGVVDLEAGFGGGVGGEEEEETAVGGRAGRELDGEMRRLGGQGKTEGEEENGG